MPDSRYLLAALFVAVALPGGAWFVVRGLEGAAVTEAATVLREPRLLPEFHLVDQHNRPFTRDDLRGRTSLLFFGFTHCPDICPATLGQLALARRQLAAAGSGDTQVLPQIVLISVDPARDTPEVLAQYVDYFGSGITGVTGPVTEIRTLGDALGIHFERAPDASGNGDDDYSVSHSAAVLVIDSAARLEALFSAPHRVENLVHDLPLLMGETLRK